LVNRFFTKLSNSSTVLSRPAKDEAIASDLQYAKILAGDSCLLRFGLRIILVAVKRRAGLGSAAYDCGIAAFDWSLRLFSGLVWLSLPLLKF
jgi:hypothetical protein